MKPRLPLAPAREIELSVDGRSVRVPEGASLLQACRTLGIEVPTLCHAPNLTPVNVCRVCVVELQGARALVPACSRRAEAGMVVLTDSERVRLARRMVLELLASSVDLSAAPEVEAMLARWGADPTRFGPAAPAAVAGEREQRRPGAHAPPRAGLAETVGQPPKLDNALFVRDYAKCMLCYKCVEACGADAQNTFAIAVAGRGFDARVATELDVPLPESACVFCGNCIGVCPTGALMFQTEFQMRAAGEWDESRQTRSETICAYCGVGCVITLHVQDGAIVKATSPADSEVTNGQLCIKGRFGWSFVKG